MYLIILNITPPPRQKVTLWQHADKLEQEQVAKGTWINEKSIPECMGCGMTFSVFNRKVGDLWATLLPHFKTAFTWSSSLVAVLHHGGTHMYMCMIKSTIAFRPKASVL